MPRNLFMSGSSEMDLDITPNRRLSEFRRNGSTESHGSSSRSRSSSTYDDESLSFLTHEEKDVLMFFEETIDSFEEEYEKGDSSDFIENFEERSETPRLPEENGSSHSENEDIIDLVQARSSYSAAYDNFTVPDYGKVSETDKSRFQEPSTVTSYHYSASHGSYENSQAISTIRDIITAPPSVAKPAEVTSPKNTEKHLPEFPVDHPKAYLGQHSGFVPTPVVLTQKHIERQTDNDRPSQAFPKSQKTNEHIRSPPTSPSHGREFRSPPTSPSHGREFSFRHNALSPPKLIKFPGNINVTVTGKEYNNTITKAAVKVQERKAQVLANLNGAGFVSPEQDEKAHTGVITGRARSSSFKDQAVDHSRHEALSKLGLVKEAHVPPETNHHMPISSTPKAIHSSQVQSSSPESVNNGHQNISSVLKGGSNAVIPTGKPVVFKPDPGSTENKISRSSTSQSFYENKCASSLQDIRRVCSLPRQSTGFRPQGITVQFSGRGATEESRREALRKLGLLKST